jgi:hypothetical protein
VRLPAELHPASRPSLCEREQRSCWFIGADYPPCEPRTVGRRLLHLRIEVAPNVKWMTPNRRRRALRRHQLVGAFVVVKASCLVGGAA